ncbi:hypothetical protein Tsubulata_038146 [Turnera subulata]|uniref:GDSL esterase/lipase n=1 Tax=Turnera subulata TaxID=218843 RepID=A0A9Q0FU19_9ROSI|nr:hypothetical protein Tsubulata_038146 [Turnera subulata]
MVAPTLLQALIAITFCTYVTTCAITLPNISNIVIFGDSTVDSGNNNYIKSVIKSNHYPYGLNFPYHIPTGRFSDGKLIPDLVASFLNIKDSVPPFLDPSLSDYDIRTGVCFASAGSGYDDLTYAEIGVIPLPKQLEMFKNYISRLKGIVGEEEANKTVGSSLIMISSGNNDLLAYSDALSPRRLQLNVDEYQDFLLKVLQNFVQELYDLGGRLFIICGVAPLGCLPMQMTVRLVHTCLEDENAASRSYNGKLESLLPTLKESLPGSTIAYTNVYDPIVDMVDHPQKYGFVETHRGCCGTGLVEVSFLCNVATPVCSNASQYLFWDSIHPTEAAYKFLFDALIKEILNELSTQ